MPFVQSDMFPLSPLLQIWVECAPTAHGHAKRSRERIEVLKDVAVHARNNCPYHTDNEIAAMLRIGKRTLRRWIAQDADFSAKWYRAKKEQIHALGLIRAFMELSAIKSRVKARKNPDAWKIEKYLRLNGVDWFEAVRGEYLEKRLQKGGLWHSSRARVEVVIRFAPCGELPNEKKELRGQRL